jgi:hypothetical protein
MPTFQCLRIGNQRSLKAATQNLPIASFSATC